MSGFVAGGVPQVAETAGSGCQTPARSDFPVDSARTILTTGNGFQYLTAACPSG